MKTYGDLDAVLECLHSQGSSLITKEVLEDHATLLEDWRHPETGEAFPCVAFQNGVRWFFDKERRPARDGMVVKALAPSGRRALLGNVGFDGEVVLFEGERDWLTGLSVGIEGALCVGGVDNLDDTSLKAISAKAGVIVVFDNDDAGTAASNQVAAKLALAGCRTVKIATIPVAGADFSEWLEEVEGGTELAEVLTMLRGGHKIGKREAKAVVKQREEERRSRERESDEFVSSHGDLFTVVWVPKDPEVPQDEEAGGRARFCRHDAAASAKNGLLVVELLDRYEDVPPDVPSAYAKPPHLKEQPPVMVPISGQTLQERILVLPDTAKEHGTSDELFERILKFIDAYFVCDPRFAYCMASYVLLTYRYRDARFEVLPYIRVTGTGAGTGKTRFARVMAELCNRSVMVAGMRPAHLYRIIQHTTQCTLVFEEFDMTSSDDRAEFTNLLNAGNQRGTNVPRMTGRHFSDIEWLRLFCPKVISMQGDFQNEGLLRRCLTGRVGELPIPDDKLFHQLPPAFYLEAAELRRKLLGWRFAKRDQPCPDVDPRLRGSLSPGVWQNYYPVVAMVPGARRDAVEAILSVANEGQHVLETTRKTSPAAHVLASVGHVATIGDEKRAWIDQVVEDLLSHDQRERWTRRDVLRILRELALHVGRSRRGGRDGTMEWYVDVDDRYVQVAKAHDLEAASAEQGRPAPHVM